MKKKIYLLIFVAGVSGALLFYTTGKVYKYDPLLIQEINVSSSLEYNLKYQNLYDGNHAIVLISEIPVSIGEDYNTNGLKADINLNSASGDKISKVINEHLYPFWDDRYSGIALIRYVVPNDLPKQEQVVLNISFYGNSKDVIKKYKFTKLLVIKLSDK